MIKLINQEKKRQTFHVNEFQVIYIGCSYFVLKEGKHNFSLLSCGGSHIVMLSTVYGMEMGGGKE